MEPVAESPPAAAAARLPWDFHPALTEERLRVCARMLANARRDALAMASYELGDDPWSVGCRAFAFGRHRLKRAAESGEYPWLEVLDDSAHFVFVIGSNGQGVPVRFYRGAADDPTDRTLKRQEIEAEQLSLALGEEAADGLVFRFAVETGEGGRVDRVVFLALRGEDRVECFWPVPLEIPPAAGATAEQLRLIADDGYAGPPAQTEPAPPMPAPLPRRKPMAPISRRQGGLF
ncbi:hypothetical protein [Paracraurococcus ruber]|uniref:Uncharacterized protein n=1 Tax=Paracraurococcus ruber TaxID=77675 RepID=A0ABS1D090_9PROT|nr:hypothetical protein [Paracraurococcus ruber]MBK1659692.1 hypothetical protein [Paracraurococcus ruber]TDG29193.1 hypothetical protein E2C05_18545 [Paracraurococcus ruber]